MLHQENKELIEHLAYCIAACEHCADECLSEDDPSSLAECIRLDRDCADICKLALTYISRDSVYSDNIVEECADICIDCADECEKHEHDHCRNCAEVCRACAKACGAFV